MNQPARNARGREQGGLRLGGETSASGRDAVDGTLLRNFAYFRLRSGLAMWFCPLDTAAVTELWRLDLFSCTSSSFLCAGTLFPRGRCCYFCGRFSWSRQTSHSKGFPYYFHDSTRELYFRSTTCQCRCYSKTKTTKYCLKQEGKSHPCHPLQN